MAELNTDLDVVIIGAGPAGISAVMWCNDLGLRAVVLEKEAEPGGQLLSVYNPITNYPGLRAENGRELRDRFLETAISYDVDIRLATDVVNIDAERMTVATADGQEYSARSIIVATGVRRRKLNIPGEDEFRGKGIIESGSRDKEFVRGKTAVIIGGGDAALENALILSDRATEVYVIHRRETFTARDEFLERARKLESIKFLVNSRVSRINGSDRVESVEVIDQATGEIAVLRADVVLARIGVEPNSQLVSDRSTTDQKGYVETDRDGQTILEGVFAAGDICTSVAPTIIGAAGMGATAAKSVQSLLRRQKGV